MTLKRWDRIFINLRNLHVLWRVSSILRTWRILLWSAREISGWKPLTVTFFLAFHFLFHLVIVGVNVRPRASYPPIYQNCHLIPFILYQGKSGKGNPFKLFSKFRWKMSNFDLGERGNFKWVFQSIDRIVRVRLGLVLLNNKYIHIWNDTLLGLFVLQPKMK